MPVKHKASDKTISKAKPKVTPQDIPQIQPLSTTTCPTLSRKSKLTYELGQDAAKGFHYRIVSCDGGGFFSPEWIAWPDIQTAIKKSLGPITSLCLRPLFKGKSVNTSGYLLAVLLAEGLLSPLPKKVRHFQLTDNNPEGVKTKPRSAPAKKAKTTRPKAAKA